MLTPTTGEAILEMARRHINETYVLGARAPMANPDWKGPWDCAEFCSWCVYQASGILFGVEPRHDPVRADAYTGYWGDQASAAGAIIEVDEAARIAGACVLRVSAADRGGHIVFSDGSGGTLEAHGSADGVVALKLSGRRWDYGILVPGIRYLRNERPVSIAETSNVLRLTDPMTRGNEVLAVQKQLAQMGYHPGAIDGVFGPQTQSAVHAFQADSGLVPDGEVGPSTLKALRRRRSG